jgi:hypothetical protein
VVAWTILGLCGGLSRTQAAVHAYQLSENSCEPRRFSEKQKKPILKLLDYHHRIAIRRPLKEKNSQRQMTRPSIAEFSTNS